MDIKLMLNEQSIDDILEYIRKHPQESRALINSFANEFFNLITNPQTVKKAAGFYKAMNKEINRKYWDQER